MGNASPQSLWNESYGHHSLVTEGALILVEKTYCLESKQTRDSLEVLLKTLKQIDSPTILSFPNVFECKNGFDVVVQYEHLPVTLQNEIDSKKQHYLKYSERQVVNVLDCLLSSLMLLSFKGLQLPRISLSRVLVREDPRRYVMSYSPLMLATQSQAKNNNCRTLLENPEELKQAKVDPDRGAVFTLGALALTLCHLRSLDSIYLNSEVNEFQLLNLIGQCSDSYSNELVCLMREMLSVAPEERPSISQASTIIRSVIQNQAVLREQYSSSRSAFEKIELSRREQMQQSGLNTSLPTFCFVTDREFVGELYEEMGAQLYETNESAWESSRSKVSRRKVNKSIIIVGNSD